MTYLSKPTPEAHSDRGVDDPQAVIAAVAAFFAAKALVAAVDASFSFVAALFLAYNAKSSCLSASNFAVVVADISTGYFAAFTASL